MKIHLGLFIVSAGALLVHAADDKVAGLASANSIVAEVDGQAITMAEFERARPSALFQAKNAFYDAEKKAVEDYLDDYLLERQARKENVTVEELLKKHVDNLVGKDPDDSALAVYYEGLDINEPLSAVKDKILEHIRTRRLARLKTAYMKSLREQAKISIELTAPRTQISLKDTPVRGAGAKVTLVEYADYECPYCQQVQPQLERLESEYKGKIAFAYKDMPLPMHTHAQKAAEAASCAGTQNKYWEYHDALVKSKDLEVSQLKATASKIGLNTSAFNSCLDSGERAGAVRASLDEATKLGLNGTPSFFLNGRFFSGNIAYEQLRQMVDEELTRASSLSQENPGR